MKIKHKYLYIKPEMFGAVDDNKYKQCSKKKHIMKEYLISSSPYRTQYQCDCGRNYVMNEDHDHIMKIAEEVNKELDKQYKIKHQYYDSNGYPPAGDEG
jgi:hypothetical protein